jgi:RNA polymerase sigma-70 factor (ECF subfamily)
VTREDGFDAPDHARGVVDLWHVDVDLRHAGRMLAGNTRLLNKPDYNHWLSVAARHARRRDEAEDLLHESLLAAVQARRTDLSDEHNRAWLAGTIRNKAMMAARTAGRRKRRESAAGAPELAPPQPALAAADEGTYQAIRALPAGARIVAILALHGLTREEIACALDLAPEALRQRLTTLRKRWGDLSQDVREEAIDRAHARRRTLGQALESGLIRRALLAFLHEQPGVGTHDPDGHLIILDTRPSRTAPPRQRTGKPAKEA